MNIAVLKDGVCIDATVFTDYETAQDFFNMGVWVDADAIAELPDGYGIGDFYDGTTWTKAHQPELPTPEPIPYEELVRQYIHERYSVDDELGLTNAAVEALATGGDMPEEYVEYRAYVDECKERAHEEVI